jgi:hypothetical protein
MGGADDQTNQPARHVKFVGLQEQSTGGDILQGPSDRTWVEEGKAVYGQSVFPSGVFRSFVTLPFRHVLL